MQITKVDIKKSCREINGKSIALHKAWQIISKAYDFSLEADVNKDATFTIYLMVDRNNNFNNKEG